MGISGQRSRPATGLKPADTDMPPARYNPFEKPLAQIDVADLATLRAVPEGWYIEYKRELPTVRSIAKSISSLANTYGGWVFYGIEENGADRTPGAFPGISADDVSAAQMSIRQAVSSSISPPPYFEARALAGPHAELGLAEGRSIIVVEVPLSFAAPHIHRDGRIYRRVADESDPRPETDRHFLDLLWQRGERRRTELQEWLEHTPRTSDAEAETSYLELFIIPVPWRERTPTRPMNFDEFAAVMRNDPTLTGVPFENVFSSAEGYVARQARGNNPDRLLLTWQYSHYGT